MRLLSAAAAALSLIIAGCSEPASAPPSVAAVNAQANSSSSTLLECPISQSSSVTQTIGISGGTISLNGHSISLPFGAVLLPTQITLTEPASNYVEVDIRANGLESFQFEQPVGVTLSYARCTRANIDKGPVKAWYINTQTKAFIADMNGVDNRPSKSISFGTGHLSTYAVAY
jgi:hypothetical protein